MYGTSRGPRGLLFLRVLFLFLVFANPTNALGKTPICDFRTIQSEFAAGLQHYKAKKYAGAIGRWQPLAEQGFPPAQGRMAWLIGNGFGRKAALEKATFWAWLGSWGGDVGGARLLQRLKKALPDAKFKKAIAKAKSWRPNIPDCWDGKPSVNLKPDGRNIHFRKYLITIDDSLPEKSLEAFSGGMRMAIETAYRAIPIAPFFLPAIDVFEIIPSDKYDRYVGWKRGAHANVMLVSLGNFLDSDPSFLALAITQEAIRMVFSRTPEAYYVDPFVRSYKKKNFYGSNPNFSLGEYFIALILHRKMAMAPAVLCPVLDTRN